MKALVVGYGSIGARHARLLDALGCDVAVCSARQVEHPRAFSDLDQALDRFDPGYVVIANATDRHLASLLTLAGRGFAGRVLVEKPLFAQPVDLPALPFGRLAVAYNLRFHPVLRALHAALAGQRVLSVQAYVGQYLPSWRPGTDYRQSYSSHASQGGGVLRDLSHELDFLQHLFGPWQRVAATGGHLSSLEGDSDDTFGLMMSCERCQLVQLQLNYTDRVGRRRLLVNTDDCTIEADLVAGRLQVDGEARSFDVARDATYLEMHRAMLDLAPQAAPLLCGLDEGRETLALIGAAERASQRHQWELR